MGARKGIWFWFRAEVSCNSSCKFQGPTSRRRYWCTCTISAWARRTYKRPGGLWGKSFNFILNHYCTKTV
jgi:hypothetical protein